MSGRKIIDQLKELSTKERKEVNEWFFKTGKGGYSEFDKFIGVSMPNIRKIAKYHYKNITNNEIAKLVKNSIHEVRLCGFIILVYKYQQKDSDKEDVYNFYINNLDSVNNWDIVDSSAPHIMGDYITQNNSKITVLYGLSKSNNLWKKRVSIVATFAFIKINNFIPTLRIAKELLQDDHDLIHKAIGWMLREVYKRDNESAKVFLRENYTLLPRTTLRYAIERMDELERKSYLKGKF